MIIIPQFFVKDYTGVIKGNVKILRWDEEKSKQSTAQFWVCQCLECNHEYSLSMQAINYKDKHKVAKCEYCSKVNDIQDIDSETIGIILHTDITLVDRNIYEQLKDYRWSKTSNNYVSTTTRDRKYWLLHRFIMSLHEQLEDNDIIDHINGNTLDNRLVNLRKASGTLNSFNVGSRSNSKSGIIGVCYDESKQRWKAYIRNKERNCSRSYKTFEEAIIARYQGEIEYYNEPLRQWNEPHVINILNQLSLTIELLETTKVQRNLI